MVTLFPLTAILPLLAQEATSGRGYTISWFLILLSVIMGMVIMLRPAKREEKVPVRKD